MPFFQAPPRTSDSITFDSNRYWYCPSVADYRWEIGVPYGAIFPDEQSNKQENIWMK